MSVGADNVNRKKAIPLRSIFAIKRVRSSLISRDIGSMDIKSRGMNTERPPKRSLPAYIYIDFLGKYFEPIVDYRNYFESTDLLEITFPTNVRHPSSDS
jgi:hypothetical protein